MKLLISTKTIVGLLSSTAITGSLYMGLVHETNSLPSHWHIAGTRAAPPVEVLLLSEQKIEEKGGYSCDWLSPDSMSPDSKNRLARCPQMLVTAKRL
jgi:hypothetical protein